MRRAIVSPAIRPITRKGDPTTSGSSDAATTGATGTPTSAAAANSRDSLSMLNEAARGPARTRCRIRGSVEPSSASNRSNSQVSRDAPPDSRRSPRTSTVSRSSRAARKSPSRSATSSSRAVPTARDATGRDGPAAGPRYSAAVALRSPGTVTSMASRLVALCFDANDPLRLARFWADALRWDVGDETDDEVGLVPTDGTRFRIAFVPVPEPKVGKNRLHLDLTTTSLDDQTETVERLIELGGRPHRHRSEPGRRACRARRPRGQRALHHRADQQLPRRLRAPRIDHLRRHAGGRVLLERGARMAVGLGSGRGDRDPRAGPHRSDDHLGSDR